MSCVMWDLSHVTCDLSLTSTATATDPPPANSPTMHSWLVCRAPNNKKCKTKKSLKPQNGKTSLEVCQYWQYALGQEVSSSLWSEVANDNAPLGVIKIAVTVWTNHAIMISFEIKNLVNRILIYSICDKTNDNFFFFFLLLIFSQFIFIELTHWADSV